VDNATLLHFARGDVACFRWEALVDFTAEHASSPAPRSGLTKTANPK
jgi:hypothetical protein